MLDLLRTYLRKDTIMPVTVTEDLIVTSVIYGNSDSVTYKTNNGYEVFQLPHDVDSNFLYDALADDAIKAWLSCKILQSLGHDWVKFVGYYDTYMRLSSERASITDFMTIRLVKEKVVITVHGVDMVVDIYNPATRSYMLKK